MSKIRANFISSKNDNKAVEFTSGIVVGGAVTATNFDFNAEVYNVGTGASISNPANNVLALGTNNTEKVRITSAGFIGAGTANPRRHFHLHNSATATVGFQMTNGGTGESNDSQGFQLKVGSDGHAEIAQMENSNLRIFTNASERLRITSGGRLLIGHNTSVAGAYDNSAQTKQVQIVNGANSGDQGLGIYSYSSAGWAPRFELAASRSSSKGGHTIVTNGQSCGLMVFNGSDGTNFSTAAMIGANVEGTPANDSIPGSLSFYTSPGSGLVERLRISSGGIVTKPNHPCFMVSNSTAANAFSANAKATWNQMSVNNGSHFDDANDRFVCPVDGIYYFSCQMLSMSGQRLFHELRKNEARIYGTVTESYDGTTLYQTNTLVAVVSASANDRIDVKLGAGSGGGYGNIYANFNGYLIG